MEKTWFNRSETSTHSHPEEEIERSYEEERKGSPIPIFPPLRFGIVRIFLNSVGFCSQVSALWGKHGSIGLQLRPTVTRRRKLREVVKKRGKVPLYPYFHPQASELWDCWLAKWAFALKFRPVGKTWLTSLWAEERVLYRVWGVALDWFLSSGKGFYPLWYYFGVLAWVAFI